MRRDLLWIGLAAAILFGANVGGRDLWNPNEPTYGLAVREMAERGDWRQPTVEGRAFDEKPIGYFWLARVASLPTGIGETTLRLPAVASGIALVLLTYLWVAAEGDRRRARLAAAVLATMVVVAWQSRTVQMDTLLAAGTAGTVLCLARAWAPGARRGVAWGLLGGLFLAFGILAKGPVALVVAGGPVLAWAVVERRWSAFRSPAGYVAVAVGLLLAAPWFVWQGMQSGAGLTEVLWRQNVERFTEAWDHQQPPWYYAVQLWNDFAPWVWCLPATLALAVAGKAQASRRRLAFCWLLVVMLFFSLSDSKRSVYLLPAAPAVAALVADVLAGLMAGHLSAWRRRWCLAVHALCAGLLLALGASVLRLVPERYPLVGSAGDVVGWVLVLSGAATAASVAVHRLRPAWATPTLAGALGRLVPRRHHRRHAGLRSLQVRPAAGELDAERSSRRGVVGSATTSGAGGSSRRSTPASR